MNIKTVNELVIGDVVELLDVNDQPCLEAYNTMTVINVTDKQVEFFRPYVHLADFIYTGGVLPYVGISQDSVPLNHPAKYWHRGNIYRGRV